MIASHGCDGRQVQRGLQQSLRSISGALAARVVERPHSVIAAHNHDWPVLTLYLMGDAMRLHDGGEVRLNRPAVALHTAGEMHAGIIGSAGVEQIDIEFDPAWLSSFGATFELRSGIWVGGRIAAKGRVLADMWASPACGEAQLAEATASLLHEAAVGARTPEPPWLKTALDEVERGRARFTAELARHLGLHPGWLAQSYRAAVGEGLGQTFQRRRVERAATLLRTTRLPAAAVAVDAGFCDQSHMIRSFKRLLGRSPQQVRTERAALGLAGGGIHP